MREAQDALTVLRREAREQKQDAKTKVQRDRLRIRYAKKIERAKRKVETAKNRLQRTQDAQAKAKTKDTITVKKRTWNLGTSLKSYIDPRVVYEWGQRVDYDVLERYYPKALQRKFAWAKSPELADDSPENTTDRTQFAGQ